MDKALYDKGLGIRREVLGAEYVENSLKSADAFTKPLQELVTEYCWGAVWGRDGLEKKTRSFINLAMIAALNRPHELKLHVNGALNNGCTPDEIREVCLMVALYAGVPASNEAHRIALETFRERGITTK